MTELTRFDLNSLSRDANSFLMRAITLGIRFNGLPEHFGDSFLAYLKAKSLEHAHRRRTGIALGKQSLRTGIEQAFACIDIALEQATGSNVEQAITLLATGDFTALHKQGCEIGYQRLQRMRNESKQFGSAQALDLLPELRTRLDRWRRIVPEVWSFDPRTDYEIFEETLGKIQFVHALPRTTLQSAQVSSVNSFEMPLTHLLAAGVLQIDTLHLTHAAITRLGDCFTDGNMHREIRHRVVREIEDHTTKSVESPRVRSVISGEMAAAIHSLEQASADTESLLLEISVNLVADMVQERAAARTDIDNSTREVRKP